MQFCPKCGSVLYPKKVNGKVILECKNCKYTTEKIEKDKYKVKVVVNKKDEDIPVIKEEIKTLPTTRAECPKCGNKEAYVWIRQTRAADEPGTRFFRCTKCGYTWREYS